MKASFYRAAAILGLFFGLVFAFSFAYQRHYPMLVLAGEASVGTWMSGVLLIMAVTISLIIGMRQRDYPWFLVAVFFMVLALDERFMFHERLKERIIFSFPTTKIPVWLYELPVITGACAGALVAILLWHYLAGISRLLLLGAVTLGTVSVVMDVLSAGVWWEECGKLTAELLMTFALLRKVAK